MVTYPICVPRHGYKGSNTVKRTKVTEKNRVASELEKYLNDKISTQEQPIQSYLYCEIASDTGYDIETVREILFGVDCGHNGLTVALGSNADTCI